MITIRLSLKDKLTLVIAAAIFIVVAGVSYNFYQRSKSSLVEYLRTDLRDLAASFAMQFDKAEVETVLKGTEKAKPYWALKQKLERLRQVDNKKIQSIYIMVPTVVDNIWAVAGDSEFKDPKQVAHLHDKYDVSRYEEMKKALQGPTADKEINSDSWGSWFSGYAPIYDKDRKAFAVLGLDMRAGDVEKLRQQALNVALFYILIGAIVALILGWLTAGAITAPIMALVQGVKRIKARQFGTRIDINRDDELGELIISFNEMAKKLGEVDRIKSDFLSVVSHELYTPLTPIRAGANQLKMNGLLPEDHNKIVKMIENQAIKLQELVDEILDFSWLEVQEWRLNKEPVFIPGLMDETVAILQEAIDRKKIKLNLDYDRDLPTILADKKRLLHVLKIVVDNAIKFNYESGGVTVKIAPVEARVEFTIKDNGIGIAPENINLVFESFYQAEYYLNRTHGGVGLGLAIAKKIIEAHNGNIHAESEGLGKGSAIIFSLPIA